MSHFGEPDEIRRQRLAGEMASHQREKSEKIEREQALSAVRSTEIQQLVSAAREFAGKAVACGIPPRTYTAGASNNPDVRHRLWLKGREVRSIRGWALSDGSIQFMVSADGDFLVGHTGDPSPFRPWGFPKRTGYIYDAKFEVLTTSTFSSPALRRFTVFSTVGSASPYVNQMRMILEGMAVVPSLGGMNAV